MLVHGKVTPPADMIGAARRDLTPERFEALMAATGGQPPSPAQLVQAVEEQRHDDRAERNPTQ